MILLSYINRKKPTKLNLNKLVYVYIFVFKNPQINRALSFVVRNFTCPRSENKTAGSWSLGFAMTVPIGKRAILKLAGMPFLVAITEPVDNVLLSSFGDVNQLSIVTC